MDVASVVASSEETEDITVGLHFAAIEESLGDTATIEFALGPRRRVTFGTPPPPPADLYAVRLGLTGNRPRRNLLIPLVTVLLLVTAIGVGLNLRADPADPQPESAPAAVPSRPAVPVAVTTLAPSTGAPLAAETAGPATAPRPTGARAQAVAPDAEPAAVDPAGPAPTPTLTGPTTVPFGQSVVLRAGGFPCGAGAQLNISIAGYYVATADTDAQGGAAVLVAVEVVAGTPGQVALSGTSDYLTLAPGSWVIRAESPAQAGCTAVVSAGTTITVNPPQ